MSKSLVVYYSRSGNTEHIAEAIKEKTGSDILKIEAETDYSAWMAIAAVQALSRGKEVGIKTVVPSIREYDTIYIGSPTWWYTIAPPLATFLKKHDLSGKKVILFCTNDGGNGTSVEDAEKLCPGADFEVGAFFYKDTKNDLDAFLEKLV